MFLEFLPIYSLSLDLSSAIVISMVSKNPKLDNIIPRVMDSLVRHDTNHSRDIVKNIRSQNRDNLEERKMRLDLTNVELQIRSRLAKRYHGEELERRVTKCLESALTPYNGDTIKSGPHGLGARENRKDTKAKMKSRRR